MKKSKRARTFAEIQDEAFGLHPLSCIFCKQFFQRLDDFRVHMHHQHGPVVAAWWRKEGVFSWTPKYDGEYIDVWAAEIAVYRGV